MRFIACLFLMLPLAGPAFAADANGVSIDLMAGGRAVDIDSPRDAHFQEFGTIEEGAILSYLKVERLLPDKPFAMGFKGTAITNENQSFKGWFERAGLGRLTLYYDQTPHHYSNGSTLLHKQAPGLYTIDATMRAAWEAAAFGATPTTDLPPLVQDGIASTGRTFDVGLRRDTYGFRGDHALSRGWTVRGGFGHEKRAGTRPFAVGTYVRNQPTDSTFDRERFDIRGQEFPEDVDYRVFTGNLATDIRGKKGFVEGGVDVSVFRNELLGLQWDNPFEAPDPMRTIDGGSQANRGRYDRGQIALPPDNEFTRVHVSAMYRFHPRLRVTVTGATSRMTQDDTFLPFSLNDSIYFPGLDGALGTSDDVLASDLSLLPQTSLDGKVVTSRADLRFSAHPTRSVNLELKGRFYQYDNQTAILNLPGYAAFGESAYRRSIGQRDASNQLALFNAPSEYIEREGGLSGTVRVRPDLHVSAGAEHLIRDYTGRQVDKTTEDVLHARVRGSMRDRVQWSAFYQMGRREHDGDYELGLELSGVRAFDVWDRDRDLYGAEIDLEANEKFSIGVGARRTQDDYPGKVDAAAHPYGLQSSETTDLSVSMHYRASERWTLSGSAGVDQSEWTSLGVAKTPFNADATGSYEAANRWVRNQDDETVWGSIDLAGALVPKKLTCKLSYNVNAYKGDVVSTNPETPTINSGLAVDWSELKTTTQDVKLQMEYQVAPTLGFVLKYRYSPFRLDDPAWNSLAPYLQGTITEVRSSATDIQATNAARYLYMDNRYDDTDSHVLVLAVRASLK